MDLGIADELAAMGVTILRGGAFKPRTSPYAFQGLGEKGLRILADVRSETGLPEALSRLPALRASPLSTSIRYTLLLSPSKTASPR